MLAAFKNTTVTHLQQQIVQIKNMELTYWMSTFRTMTTESSLLTGFCFAGMRAAQGSDEKLLNFFYLAITATSMGFGLLCITTASFSLIFGTQRALMGEQAFKSMDIAVETLKQKSFQSFYLFIAQLCFFFLSAFLLMWILYTPIVALTANLVLGICLFFFVTNGAELVDLLYISDDEAINHVFGDDEIRSGDDRSVGGRSAGGRSVGGVSGLSGMRSNGGLRHLQRQVNLERQSEGQSMNDSEMEAEMRDVPSSNLARSPDHKQLPKEAAAAAEEEKKSQQSSERLSKRHRYQKFFDNF